MRRNLREATTNQRESLLSMELREHRPLIAAKGATLQMLLIKTDCVSEFHGKAPHRMTETQQPVAVDLTMPINLTMKLSIYIK